MNFILTDFELFFCRQIKRRLNAFFISWLMFSTIACYQPIAEKPVTPYSIIRCDAEQISFDSLWFITDNAEYKLSDGKQKSDEKSRSGKYSLKLSGDKHFGFTVKIEHPAPDDYFMVSVWYKSKSGKGLLIAQADSSQELYLKTSRAVNKDSTGWEKLSLEFNLPPNYSGSGMKIYVWNPDTNEVFFDDFELIRKKEKLYPSYDIPSLNIFIDSLEFEKIKQKRQDAFDKGFLFTKEDDWVKAIIFYKDQEMKAKMRLKGDRLDHLYGKKWSFRIKLKKKYRWKKMRTFSIQSPRSRLFIKEWLAHKFFENEDILTTRYGFVPVKINGKSMGVYAWEEHFDKHLVESKKRREGPIIKFDDNIYWVVERERLKKNTNILLPVSDATIIAPFKESRMFKNPILKENFNIGQNLVYQYKYAKEKASNLFHPQQLAKFYALMDLLKSYHSIHWINERFYFNPVICKLEPIAYDCYSDAGVFNWENRTLLLNKQHGEAPSPFYRMATDSVLMFSYIKFLEAFSNADYSQNIYTKYKQEILDFESILKKEYTDYAHDSLFVKNNANKIKKTLPDFKNSVYNQHFLDSLHRDELQIMREYDSVCNNGMANDFINIYTEYSSDSTALLKIENYFCKPIILIGTGAGNKLIGSYFAREDTLYPANDPKGYSTVNYTHPRRANYLFYYFKNRDEFVSKPINHWQSPKNINLHRNLKTIEYGGFDFIRKVDNKTLRISAGKYQISTPMIIPKGYNLVVEAGAELNFINNAFFLSYSPVKFSGTQEKRIKIYSSDKKMRGFTVLQTERKSVIKHTTFSDMNTLNYNGWTLTGGVNFYEADVEIYNTSFLANQCEDALNIIRSDFNIQNCSFKNIFADAFDSDFCTGELKNSRFITIGNDAIDFSGSKIIIDSCYISHTKDKGISGGEKSDLKISNCTIDNVVIGIASKDESKLNVNDSEISIAKYAYAIFQKKYEFGPARIETNQITLNNILEKYLIEQKSVLIENGDTIQGFMKDVAKILYDKEQ